MSKLLRLPDVMAATGLSRSEIYRRLARGEFPRRIPLSADGRAIAFDEQEIQEWIRACIARRDRRETVAA